MIRSDILRPCAAAAIALGTFLASTAGCSGMKTSQSQLFGTQGNYQSASITYRIEQNVPSRGAGGPAWVKNLVGRADLPTERRITMLAVRYPHPAGRAGYARLECIVAAAPTGGAGNSQPPGWLERIGKLADDGLPGIALAEGIHEAMGLDVPVSELSGVLARLEQSQPGAIAAQRGGARQQVVQVSYELNGAAQPPRTARVAELDQLIARVRRDGSLISHTSSVAESLVSPPAETIASAPATISTMPAAQPAAPVVVALAGGAIQPASHQEPLVASPPTVQRLPPVESARR
ncbi:MAG: hypothetical protein WD845_11575 [Pirellulales bacterium]